MLDDELGLAVRISGGESVRLGNRQLKRFAVHGGRGAEHHAAHRVPRHGLQQLHGAADIVVIVEQRLFNRLADRLEAGEMDHGFDRRPREDALERAGVAQIRLVERHRSRGRHLAQAVEHHAFGIDEAVYDRERVPGLGEGEATVRADVAEPAGDEDGWHVQILPTAKRNPAVAGFRRGPVLEAEAGFAGRGRSPEFIRLPPRCSA
jgi:hypothetical protein